MKLRSYLDEMGIRYSWSHHEPAYTAQTLAMREHVSGKHVIKPVVVEADGQMILCALPAAFYIDVERLREELGAREAKLAPEPRFAEIFADCEPGAEPPIGKLFGMKTVMDDSLMKEQQVTFQAGTHEDAVTMSLSDYVKAARPIVGHFGKQGA